MKYVYLVKSNYYGENAQGNVLGVHTSHIPAYKHYYDILANRAKRSTITRQHGPQAYHNGLDWPSKIMASFYVEDNESPELVELIQWKLHAKSKRHK